MARRLVIKGSPLQPPILDTTEATVVEFRDPVDGRLLAAFGALPGSDNLWVYSNAAEADWPQVCQILGIQ